jgi:hypothetical protein
MFTSSTCEQTRAHPAQLREQHKRELAIVSYTQVLIRGARGVRSLFDELDGDRNPFDELDGPFDASRSRPGSLSPYIAGHRALHARIIALYCRARVRSTRGLSRYTAEHACAPREDYRVILQSTRCPAVGDRLTLQSSGSHQRLHN